MNRIVLTPTLKEQVLREVEKYIFISKELQILNREDGEYVAFDGTQRVFKIIDPKLSVVSDSGNNEYIYIINFDLPDMKKYITGGIHELETEYVDLIKRGERAPVTNIRDHFKSEGRILSINLMCWRLSEYADDSGYLIPHEVKQSTSEETWDTFKDFYSED